MAKSISIRVEGLADVLSALSKMGLNAQAEIGNAVQAQALTMVSNVKRSIQRGPKTGRVYMRGNVKHRASAPYEAPATDTGTLVSSIYYTQDGPYSATIGSRLAYAYHLEYGTFRIKPRPTWTLEAFSAQQALNKKINEIILEALK